MDTVNNVLTNLTWGGVMSSWDVVFSIGILFSIVLVGMCWKIPAPTAFQHSVLRVSLALSSALAAFGLPGMIKVDAPELWGLLGAVGVSLFVWFYLPMPSKSVSIRKVGDGVRVRANGQRDITHGGVVIGWTKEMNRYRGREGQIASIEKHEQAEVFRITVDDGKYKWHHSWLESRE